MTKEEERPLRIIMKDASQVKYCSSLQSIIRNRRNEYMTLATTIKVFLTEEEKKKVNQILKHLNTSEEVIFGEENRWTKKEVYELLLGFAIKNYDLNTKNK